MTAAYLPGMEPESRKPAARKNGSPPVPVLIGRTGGENVIPPDEDWPPWEPSGDERLTR